MTTVFIAGSISISRLHERVQERINKIASSEFSVVVGDADGADTSIQECLRASHARKVTVFCTGQTPRNNVAGWPVHRVESKAKAGSRAYFTAKDVEMARTSDYGLMIWDCKSTGTLSNVLELLSEKKKSLVFVNKNTEFVTVADVSGLEELLSMMSVHARTKAEEKIGLSAKIAQLGQKQLSFTQHEESSAAHTGDGTSALDVMSKDVAPSHSTKLRQELIVALKDYIARTHLNQSEAAKIFGVTQPRISDLTRGKVDLFGLDALVNMAATAGLSVELRVLNQA